MIMSMCAMEPAGPTLFPVALSPTCGYIYIEVNPCGCLAHSRMWVLSPVGVNRPLQNIQAQSHEMHAACFKLAHDSRAHAMLVSISVISSTFSSDTHHTRRLLSRALQRLDFSIHIASKRSSFVWAHFNFIDIHRDLCLCASFLVRIAGAGAAPPPCTPHPLLSFNRLPLLYTYYFFVFS